MSTLTAYYDLACCPASFDVVSFLMLAERKRIEMKADDIKIVLLPGPLEGFRNERTMWPHTTEERNGLLNNVVLPMCHMLHSCVEVAMGARPSEPEPNSIGWNAYSMSFLEFTKSYALGIRPLDSPMRVTGPRNRITMTLREAEHWPTRNSKMVEWANAARRLKDNGFDVVLIRDTSRVRMPNPGTGTHPLAGLNLAPDASTNLYARAELYRGADLNMFVNNGPAWFALALDAAVVILRPITETTCDAHTKEAMKRFGVVEGKQMAGAPPHQRLAWCDDTENDILFQAMSFFHPAPQWDVDKLAAAEAK